ncbi:hypothetical protein LTR70_007237 [Exophiala xenobiotica]|uniref:Uncharacterized protein n=1 Tax=Lithohypha guttulata TaxID=1690604 RepID=A0ABR0K572_9EURO|nr:hypothetical protein LTR24_006821 [Lithohypha guttulata]KAK5314263.1 hypothetical protein LTR70_007237 [Exophiala xenobiotica]
MAPKRKFAQKEKVYKKEERPTCTPSEQEILDRLPSPGELTRKVISMSHNLPTYLVYVVLHASFRKPPQVIIRKSYESQFEALNAFSREYLSWLSGDDKTGLFQRNHTDQQLTSSYLSNIMEVTKKKDAAPEENPLGSQFTYGGRGKVEYTLGQRDDVNFEDDSHWKRKCVIVCEEITYEKM